MDKPSELIAASARLRVVTIGTRRSALARWQTEWVGEQLRQAWPGLQLCTQWFNTTGDRILDKPLPEIGGKGLFTEELENALRLGTIDLAVHSLKDLPIADAPGLMLGAITTRADARDVLIARSGYTLDTLPSGARVGTSSLRRTAQLRARRPDLNLLSLRGNIDTRVRKALAGEYDAIVLAAAGVQRLGLAEHISEYLPLEVMLPAPGQGALAVQCRAAETHIRDLLFPLDDAPTRAAVTAERAFLQALGGGCAAPVAAYARLTEDGLLHMVGLVAAQDGQRVIRVTGADVDPMALGARLAADVHAQGEEKLLA